MANLTILRTYALKEPGNIPSSILFRFSGDSLTIFDAFPKSIFHFLILPRVRGSLTASDLANLKSLLKVDKEQAKGVIEGLREEAEKVKEEVEEEMMERYGFKWEVWTGFHAVPSMEHLHLHVLSADLCSEKMKNKKHYNSFHPSQGFFLPIDDVLSWFDSEPSYFSNMAQLKSSVYEPLLKEDLACWKCGASMKNMPTLKTHLQEEWNKLSRRQLLKRKVQEDTKQDGGDDIVFKKNKVDKEEDPSRDHLDKNQI